MTTFKYRIKADFNTGLNIGRSPKTSRRVPENVIILSILIILTSLISVYSPCLLAIGRVDIISEAIRYTMIRRVPSKRKSVALKMRFVASDSCH